MNRAEPKAPKLSSKNTAHLVPTFLSKDGEPGARSGKEMSKPPKAESWVQCQSYRLPEKNRSPIRKVRNEMQATLKGRMDDRSGGGRTVWPVRGRVQRHSSNRKKMGLFKEQKSINRRKGRGQKREPARVAIDSNKQ